MDGVTYDFFEAVRGGHVVCDTTDGVQLSTVFQGFPSAEQLDKEVGREARSEHLTDDKDVGSQSGFEHDRHVGSVEELDGVGSTLTTESVGLDGDLDTETLKVDDNEEDEKGGQKVHDVRQTVTVKSLLERTRLVVPSEQEVEEGNESTFEFGTSTRVDGGRGESLPNDRLANVGSDEKRNTRTKTVSLLKKFIEQDDDQPSNDKLEDEKQTNTSTEILRLTVKTGENVNGSLTERNDKGEKLLGTTEKSAVLLEAEVDFDEVGTGEELHDHSRGDDGRDTEFHERTSVGGKNDTHPVQRIGAVTGDDTVKRDLRRYQKDGKDNGSPHDSALEGDCSGVDCSMGRLRR